MSTEDTLSYILNNRVSVSRYGDGELGIIRNCDIGFQKSSVDLKKRLVEVATHPIQNHICCIPYPIAKIDSQLKDNSKKWWINQIGLLYCLWNRYFKNQPILGDTQVSRFYIDYKSDENARNAINIWKQIWQDCDILIVEGDSTRLGVGNDLFTNSKSIRRILCPQKDAFAFYDKILDCVLQYARTYSLSNFEEGGGGNLLILIALGPAATIMAYDLAKSGFQAIDIGHIDIEYEWYRMKASDKVLIYNKHVQELTLDVNQSFETDTTYNSQIISKI